MSTKGFRVPPAPSKNEQTRAFDAELKNLQMAGRISQMMTQQLMENVKTMSGDLGSALNQLSILQYNLTAVQKHLNIDAKTVNDIANQQRLIDFDAGAAKQDTIDNLTNATEVGTDSTITITSTAQDEAGNDCGIFRSRLKLSECGVPDLITALAGKKAGDKVQVKLNGLTHEIELLSAKNPVLVETAAEATH